MTSIRTKVSDTELAAIVYSVGGTKFVAQAVVQTRDALERMGINNAYRWACFLGQCAHESAGFTSPEENLNYSEQAVMRVWPSRFKTRAGARKVARNPEALANRVYGGRMGNGMGNGDGWRYRGRGYIQLTGKQNYAKAAAFLGLDLLDNPDLVSCNQDVALLTAAWYFTQHSYKGRKIVEWADSLNHKFITKRINGGLHGLNDRVFLSNYSLAVTELDEGVWKKPLVKINQRGKSVKEIQTILKSLGYLRGRVDGCFGPGTKRAIVKYQSDNGLSPDGIVGLATYESLVESTIL